MCFNWRCPKVSPDHAHVKRCGIWKKIAAYEEAVSRLRKAQRLIKELHKEEERQGFLSALRKGIERKRRFIEILDGLQGYRIIDGC